MSNKWFVRCLVIAFIPIQLWFLYIMFQYPYINFNVEKIEEQWILTDINTKSQILQLGMQVGDVILQINDGEVDKYPTVIKWRTVDQADTIVASRNGTIFEVNTTELLRINSMDVSYLTAEIISLFVAIMLYTWMNRSQSARYLALVFFSIATTAMSLGASIRGDTLGKIVVGISLMLIPLALLHFLIVFLKEKGNISFRGILKYPYSFIVIHFFLYLSPFFEGRFASIIYSHYFRFVPLIFSLGVCLNLGFLVYVYFKYHKENPYISTMTKTVGVFFAISITPIVCFSFIPNALLGYEWIDSLYTSWIVLLFPLSFTYLLAAKKIYDIDLVVRRFLLTIALSIVPSVCIVGVIVALSSSREKLEHLTLAFLFTLVLLSISLYSLEYWTMRLERIVFPKKHFLQASLKKIAKKLGHISSMRELKDVILVDIVDILQVSGGAVVIRYHDFTEVISHGDINDSEVKQVIMGEMSERPMLVCFEITRNEDYSSYLVLTQKKTNSLLGSEETQWLNLIISYLSVSMENLHLIRKMNMKLDRLAAQMPTEEAAGDFSWFRKLMFELQEKERYRIAADLHDTTMQDLFLLKRKLAALFKQPSDAPRQMSSLSEILDYIDIINMSLRQSCFELHPYLLQEIGLVGTIREWVDMEKVTAPFNLEFQDVETEGIETISLDTKRHLFRVVQELLNNAKKHSNASQVTFRLRGSGSNLILTYEDDGVGLRRIVLW